MLLAICWASTQLASLCGPGDRFGLMLNDEGRLVVVVATCRRLEPVKTVEVSAVVGGVVQEIWSVESISDSVERVFVTGSQPEGFRVTLDKTLELNAVDRVGATVRVKSGSMTVFL